MQSILPGGFFRVVGAICQRKVGRFLRDDLARSIEHRAKTKGATLIQKRTITVAVSIFVAALATPFAAAVISGQLAGCPCPNFAASNYSHPFWHLAWALLLVAIALGISLLLVAIALGASRLRRTWPATGWMARCLTVALVLALVSAAGQLTAGLWAVGFMHNPDRILVQDTRPYLIVHNVGENVAIGSLFLLLMVCVLMPAADSENSSDR